jgi:hypothetical protein
MHPQVALASVVTAAVLDEFEFLKFSFELFHGNDYTWFVRCDRVSLEMLSMHSNVICNETIDNIIERPDSESVEFRRVVGEKMNAIADAWEDNNWAAVAYLDADIIVTAPIMTVVSDIQGDVVLTPNYYPKVAKHLIPIHGYYNSGFAFARNKRFHEWWKAAYQSRPWMWTDQACLNDVGEKFVVATLSDRANVGFWRSGSVPDYNSIPVDCEFLHVHLFQPLRTQRQWIDKSFALHCLKFLRQNQIPEHRRIFNEALARDKSQWYEASLRLC